jgi:hypothetical protein
MQAYLAIDQAPTKLRPPRHARTRRMVTIDSNSTVAVEQTETNMTF